MRVSDIVVPIYNVQNYGVYMRFLKVVVDLL